MPDNITILYLAHNDHNRSPVYHALRTQYPHGKICPINQVEDIRSWNQQFRSDGNPTSAANDSRPVILYQDSSSKEKILSMIETLTQTAPDFPLILLSSLDSAELAVQAIRKGAADYILESPGGLTQLSQIVSKLAEYQKSAKPFHLTLTPGRSIQRKRRGKRKGLEHKFHHTQQMLRLVIENIPQRVYWKDLSFRYRGCNPPFLKDASLDSPAEIIGKTDYDLVWHELADTYQKDDVEVVSHEKPKVNFEQPMKRENGAIRWLRSNKIPLKDIEGKVIGLLGTYEDITEHKSNEKIQKAIYKISEAAYSAQDLNTLFQEVHRIIVELIQADASFIALYDSDKKSLSFPCYSELNPLDPREENSQPTETSRRLIEHLIEVESPILLNGEDIHSLLPAMKPISCAEIPNTWLGVPLRNAGKLIGALVVQSCSPHVAYGEVEKQLLTFVSNQVAMAIERKWAEGQVRMQLQRLRALREIDLAITSSIDLSGTLRVLLDQVTNQLKVDAANVLLYNPESRTFDYASGMGFRTNALKFTRLKFGEGLAGWSALHRQMIRKDLSGGADSFNRSPLLAEEKFFTYFGVPLVAKNHVKGVLEIFHRQPLNPDEDWIDFLNALAGQAAIAIDNAELFKDLQQSNIELSLAYDTTLEGWAHALEIRDHETEGHARRVADLAQCLANRFSIYGEDLVFVQRGALLHDIGKMGIPDRILLKPGRLTPRERKIMQLHPIYAYQMLSPITFLKPAIDIPYCHHEKWDGSGYPRGLKGEQIPLTARIFAVVDVWDALTSDRPYRKAWSTAKAREYISAHAGSHFDAKVVDEFMKINSK